MVRPMGYLSDLSYLVGGSSKDAPSDILEQRRAIRQMCSYIADDSKVARHHGVTIDTVRCIRQSISGMKRKGRERTARSHRATGASQSPFGAEIAFNSMIREGSRALRDAILRARGQAIG